MKQKDLPIIAVIIIVSAVVSLFISKAIFASPKNRQQQVDVVQPITSDFPKPDSHFFNGNAIDPAQSITVGQSGNSNPFSSSTH